MGVGDFVRWGGLRVGCDGSGAVVADAEGVEV